jgi:hypothetical protein
MEKDPDAAQRLASFLEPYNQKQLKALKGIRGLFRYMSKGPTYFEEIVNRPCRQWLKEYEVQK